MPRTETVEFKGITFRRYPDSNNRADREYYRPSGDYIEDGVQALHREVWKHHNGDIPDGHLIHHKDGDTGNNDISNLECVSPQEHVERHPEMGGIESDEHLADLIESAKEWHKSDEGREWHSEHWKNSLRKVFEDSKTGECDQCGDEFEYHTSARFCSNACKSAWRRDSGRDDEERICEACRQPFTVNKYKDTRSCSRRCGGALMSWTKRVQSDG